MGLAYAAGLLLIYLLIVAQFKNYLVPLIIMAPIPLTVIGVMPGHALLGAQFTATSMIGMIASRLPKVNRWDLPLSNPWLFVPSRLH